MIEVPGAVVVCFDAPTVELFDARARSIHPVLTALGPDLLAPEFDDAAAAQAVGRLADASRAQLTIAEALLDQRALAGIGNVYKSEVLFVERVDPFARAADIDDEAFLRLVLRAQRLLLANREGGARVTTDAGISGGRRTGRLWVHGRAARPGRICGEVVVARTHLRLNRRTYWCPSCQPAVAEEWK